MAKFEKAGASYILQDGKMRVRVGEKCRACKLDGESLEVQALLLFFIGKSES
jgi:thymidylate kinase